MDTDMDDEQIFNLSGILKEQQKMNSFRPPVLTIRLLTLMIMAALLTIHLRSVRIFRWELSVSGGLIIAYCVASLGLALCAGTVKCGGNVLQAYLCAVGAVLLSVNAAVLWQRWRTAGELTRVVAELLMTLGLPLKCQVLIKISLSIAAAICLLTDLIIAQFMLVN